MTDLLQTLILTIISLSSGLVATVSGGGSGAIVVPAIIATIDEKPSIVVGSVFLMYLVSAITGLVVYRERGLLDLRSGIFLAIPTIPGVVLGTLLESYISRFQFNVSLGIVATVLASLIIIFGRKTRSKTIAQKDGSAQLASEETQNTNYRAVLNSARKTRSVIDKSGRVFSYTPNYVAGIAINLGAAFLTGLFGAGAALIIVPTTILFVRMPSHVALATTRIVLVALDIAAVITHMGVGTINVSDALILSAGGLAGALIGARIAFSLNPNTLSKLVAISLGLFGVYLVMNSIIAL